MTFKNGRDRKNQLHKPKVKMMVKSMADTADYFLWQSRPFLEGFQKILCLFICASTSRKCKRCVSVSLFFHHLGHVQCAALTLTEIIKWHTKCWNSMNRVFRNSIFQQVCSSNWMFLWKLDFKCAINGLYPVLGFKITCIFAEHIN